MFTHFITLEWKSFFRSASFGTNVVIKVFMALGALYFITSFTILGFAIYPILKENGLNPIETVNKFLIYFFTIQLIVRYFMQKMPVMNIRPLMPLPIAKNHIVHYALLKTLLSFFNWLNAFFFIPFSVMLIRNNAPITEVLQWHLGMFGIILTSNFINVLINNKDSIFYIVLMVLLGCGVAQYYGFFNITNSCAPFFEAMYHTNYMFLLPIVAALASYYFAFKFFKNHLNLDEGLAKKSEVAKTENFNWLNQFGTLGTFLKNDIRLIKRNKRSRMTLVTSLIFLFYGLLFFNNPKQPEFMGIFAGIFVSGGFLFTFGQFVPSWDSAYYQLMMSQNIQYKEYLSSKWWLVVIVTLISTLLASFYIYLGWHAYFLILVGAVYNIGVNSHMVLLGGAFVKTPIDLAQARQAFGDKQAINFKTMLIAIPKLLVPVLLYVLGKSISGETMGMLLVLVAGILGFAFRGAVFTMIEKIYKSEKYATIAAYKKN
jgi:hypothetical protein